MLYAALQNGVDVKDRVQHAGPLRCRIHPPHLHPCYKAEAERGCPGHGRLHGASHVKRKGTKKCKCVTKKHPKSKDFRCFLELLGGFEPPISSLPMLKGTKNPCTFQLKCTGISLFFPWDGFSRPGKFPTVLTD